jgi:hypothetical protein
MNWRIFETYVETAPTLSKGDVVIRDNSPPTRRRRPPSKLKAHLKSRAVLTIGPRVVRFGQPMLDAVTPAGLIEGVAAASGGRAIAVLGQVGELDAVVDQNCMDRIRNGGNQRIQEDLGLSRGRLAIHRGSRPAAA